MKKIKLFLLFITLVVLSVTNVYASSIDTVDMDIVLDSNGTATITETWKANYSKN